MSLEKTSSELHGNLPQVSVSSNAVSRAASISIKIVQYAPHFEVDIEEAHTVPKHNRCALFSKKPYRRIGASALRESQLNGSHGEYTESDDLDQPDRARRGREARNHQHQRPRDAPRERPDGAARRVNERAAQAAVQVAVVAAPEPVEVREVKVLYVVIPLGANFGYTGKRFVHECAGLWVDGDGGTYPRALPEVVVNQVTSSGAGWYVQSNKEGVGEVIVSRPCVDVMEIPRFKTLGCQPRYTYFIPLFKELRLTFPGSMETRVATAAKAKASKYFDQCMPPDLLDDTVSAFLAGKAHSSLGLLNDEAARLVNMRYTASGVVCEEEIRAYVDAGVEDVHETSWIQNGVTCAEMPYALKYTHNISVRGNTVYNPILMPRRTVPIVGDAPFFRVIDDAPLVRNWWENGHLESYNEDGMLTIPRQLVKVSLPPAFTQNLGADRPPKYKLTNYFRVIGDREFRIYDVNAANASIALKRIIGARDHEDFYYKQQFVVLASIMDAYHDFEHHNMVGILKTLRTTYDCTNQSFVIGDPTAGDDHHGIPRWHEVTTRYRESDRHAANQLFEGIETPFESSESYIEGMSFISSKARELLSHCTYDGLYEKIFTKGLDSVKNGLHHWKYYTGYNQLLTFMAPVFSREFAASIPHVKKQLREHYVKGVLLHDNEDIMVRRLNACVKKELAKAGKAPRLFVSYAAGCMYANELPEWTKVLLDRSPDPDDPAEFESVAKDIMPNVYSCERSGLTFNVYIMSKMHTGSMDKAFKEMIYAMGIQNHLHVLVYSDDSVYVGNIRGQHFAFNVDVSSCDSSQGPLVFAMVGRILHNLHPERAHGLLRQCMLPITLSHPDDEASCITVNSHGPFEGSGTVLTTILNHVASYNISMAAFYVISNNLEVFTSSSELDAQLAACIGAGAAMVGHKVSIESCRVGGEVVIEKIQFLKRSPMQTTEGEWVSAVNYGCILRSLGTCEGDMMPIQLGLTPEQFARLTERERMEKFVVSVVQGLVNEPSSPIMDALRSLFVSTTRPLAREFGVLEARSDNPDLVDGDNQDKSLDPDSVCRRYGLDSHELRELAACLGSLGLGRVVNSPAVTKIYKTDYDL